MLGITLLMMAFVALARQAVCLDEECSNLPEWKTDRMRQSQLYV